MEEKSNIKVLINMPSLDEGSLTEAIWTTILENYSQSSCFDGNKNNLDRKIYVALLSVASYDKLFEDDYIRVYIFNNFEDIYQSGYKKHYSNSKQFSDFIHDKFINNELSWFLGEHYSNIAKLCTLNEIYNG